MQSLFTSDAMEQRCRLCLSGFEHLSGGSIRDSDLRAKLGKVFHFPITEEDSLPEHICSGCHGRVLDFHAYSTQVQANQDHLRREVNEHLYKEEEPFEVVKVEQVCTGENDNRTSEWPDLAVDDLKDEEDDGGSKSDTEQEFVASGVHRKRKTTAAKHKRSSQTMRAKRDTTKQDEEDNKLLLEFFRMECEKCSRCFATFSELKVHYRKDHNVTGYLKCCDRVFFQRCKLVEHLSVHMSSDSVRCEICNKTFSSKNYLLVHKAKLHGTEEDRPYKCDRCKQSFSKECHLRGHLLSHIAVECPICKKTLTSSLSLRGHMVNMHGHRENYMCDTCGKEFRTKQAFSRHIKIHRGADGSEQVQCTVCARWLSCKRVLKVHIKNIHSDAGKFFQCDICHQTAPNSRALKEHKAGVHAEERFECEVCRKRFKRKLYLKEHLALHTGKPLYSCEICGTTFNSNANMYSHRKNRHPVEWEAKRKQQQSLGNL